jgi:hypothetical protein
MRTVVVLLALCAVVAALAAGALGADVPVSGAPANLTADRTAVVGTVRRRVGRGLTHCRGCPPPPPPPFRE